MSEIPEDLIAEAITSAFGERCPDYEPECHCCKVWKQYDHLVSATERAAKIVEDAGKPYALHTATGAMMFRAAVEKIAAAIRSQP